MWPKESCQKPLTQGGGLAGPEMEEEENMTTEVPDERKVVKGNQENLLTKQSRLPLRGLWKANVPHPLQCWASTGPREMPGITPQGFLLVGKEVVMGCIQCVCEK